MNTRCLLYRFLILSVALTLPGIALAKDNPKKGEKLEGKVAVITDGDDVILLVDKTQYRIRLLGIDAPEESQPFGKQSTKALSDKILGKTVQVTTYGQDKYERILGIIQFDRRNINIEMVKEGFAWHYKQYSDSKVLAKAEEDARKAKVGLWADENPISPWEWRHPATTEDPFDTEEKTQPQLNQQ